MFLRCKTKHEDKLKQRYQKQNVGCPRTVWRWSDCSRDLRNLKHIRRHSLFQRPPLISHLQSERRYRLAAWSKPRDDTRGHRIVDNKVPRVALTGRLGWRKVKVAMRDFTNTESVQKNVQRQIHGADVPVMSRIIRTEENSQLFLFSPGVCVYRVFRLLCLSLILIFIFFLQARIWRKLWKETSTEMKANSPKKAADLVRAEKPTSVRPDR